MYKQFMEIFHLFHRCIHWEDIVAGPLGQFVYSEYNPRVPGYSYPSGAPVPNMSHLVQLRIIRYQVNFCNKVFKIIVLHYI